MRIGFILTLVLSFHLLPAQSNQTPTRVNVVFGIGQVIQEGFNVEGNLFVKRFVFEYSHGVSLFLSNSQLEEGPEKEQGLEVNIPWTTGFGVGYRINDWLNIRVEPKWHSFELFPEGGSNGGGPPLGDYTTFTLGLGLYLNWLPFKNHNSFLKGIMLVPNLRWWPRLSSSLPEDQLIYLNPLTGNEEIHQAREIGLGNTPFFFNSSMGYSFTF
ncbi:MAG: hypothetical protein AAFR66_04540 [Bacteroidota bacterium]